LNLSKSQEQTSPLFYSWLSPFFRKSFLRRHRTTGSVELSPTYHTLACPPGAFFLDLSITFLYDLFSYVRSCSSYPALVSIRKLAFTLPSRWGRERVGVIMDKNFKTFHFDPPHPSPLPQGERGFPNGHELERKEKGNWDRRNKS